MLSAWLIGSITIPQYTFRVDATTVTVPAGTYYLRRVTPGLSLIAVVATAIVSAVGGTCTGAITRGRRVSLTYNTNRDTDWDDSPIADVLGFRENVWNTQSSIVAEEISPLLWSPGYLATPRTIQGVDGYTVPHQSITRSSDGTQVQCDHYSTETWQDLGWSHIMPERMRTADSVVVQGGTFHQFYERCAMLRHRFLAHMEIDELDGSTAAVTWDTALGPYVMRPDLTGDWYRRNVPNAEHSCPLELPMYTVAEYA